MQSIGSIQSSVGCRQYLHKSATPKDCNPCSNSAKVKNVVEREKFNHVLFEVIHIRCKYRKVKNKRIENSCTTQYKEKAG